MARGSMDLSLNENAVAALEGLYSGLTTVRELAQAREIFTFLRNYGKAGVLREVPVVNGKLLDLVALLEAITKRGGVRRVQENGLWNEVTGELGLEFDQQTLYAISVHYKNYLYDYEQKHYPPPNGTGPQHQHNQLQQQKRQQTPNQHDTGQPLAGLDQASLNAQRYEQYQRQVRQRALEQQGNARQQRRSEQLEKMEQMQQRQELLRRKAQQEQIQQQYMVPQQAQREMMLNEQQQQQQQQKYHHHRHPRLMQQHQHQQQQQQRMQPRHHQPMHQARPQQPQQPQHFEKSGYYSAGGNDSSSLSHVAAYDRSGTASSPRGDPRSRYPHHDGARGVPASIPRADLPKALGSGSLLEVCEAVNTLTLETYGAAEEELIFDEVPGLLDAIFDLMDKLNPAVAEVSSLAAKLRSRVRKGATAASSAPAALVDAAFACLGGQGEGQGGDEGSGGGGGGGLWGLIAKPGVPPSGRGEVLLLLLNALRNATFVPRNERSIGHSAKIVQHFVSICAAVDPEPEVFAASVGLFGRVAKHMDITGRGAVDIELEGCKWVEDSLIYLAPAHVRKVSGGGGLEGPASSRLSPSSGKPLSPSALEYVSSLALVFPTLLSLADEEERSRVLSSLAIFATLAQVKSNGEAFERVPGSFLERLTELLSVPMLGCDVLAPKSGAVSAEWLEANCRVLPTSIAGVDAEVRDTALEVMSFLAGRSDTLRSRLGETPGCISTITRLAIATPAGGPAESQARRVAAQILSALATVGDNHARIRSYQPEVMEAAARDSHAADLLFNGLKAVFW